MTHDTPQAALAAFASMCERLTADELDEVWLMSDSVLIGAGMIHALNDRKAAAAMVGHFKRMCEIVEAARARKKTAIGERAT